MSRLKNKNTIVLGQSRDAVVSEIMNLVNNVNDEYKDFEWDIQKDESTLYNNGRFLTKYSPRKSHENNSYRYPNNFAERISKTVTNPRFFSDTSPKPDDVKQGIRGDCWFHTILSAAATIPGLIESIAVARKEDSYKDKWVGIVVDDYLFYKTQERTPLFSVMIQELHGFHFSKVKAYVKCHNNYETIYGRCTRDALVGFGGKDYKEYKTYDIKNNPAKKDKLWSSFPSDTKKNNSIFICHGEKVGRGLIPCHVYSIVRAVNFHNKHLVEVRNPWVHGTWKGSWSDERYNKEWSPWVIQKDNKHYIEELNYFLSDHESFFMEYDDFLNQFDIIERCYYTPTEIHTAQHPGDSTFLITSHGNNGTAYPKDGIGTYTIDEGQFNLSSNTITFIKRYVNCNDNTAWNYQGQYKHNLFFGTWGATHNMYYGDFIIKRAVKVESLSLTGYWCGCYLDNRSIDYYLMDLNFNENVIIGSGKDNVGEFRINGEILPNGSVGFIKAYTSHSWNYFGKMYGSEIYGNWGTIRTPNSGTFLMWKYE
ncbi:24378_t:CDS:2 [Dentiscutata erythropus]|uniref:24378_t:CDS:1 n=1 Tax=Dentiscutata erythropus TaxID=1348616 RepID=A0A9N9EQ67_9GLOM|nr:24378_t:CDS:2 [Dentiscutata erythropus]